MSQYHEPVDEMSKAARDRVRGLASLREEIDAVDWYHQRISVSEDADLKALLEHNMLEEMEHAAMTLEWLRRNMDGWDDALRTYLMTDQPITEIEEGEEEPSGASQNSLGIGGLKSAP
jgi:uncharacterized protein